MFKEGLKILKLAKEIKNIGHHDELVRSRAAKAISSQLSNEKGAIFKIGQYLGTSEKASKEIQDLSYRQSEQVDLEVVKNFIEKVYQKNWQEVFKFIDHKAYVASIGQIHKAKTVNDLDVALKIRFPEIDDQVNEQLKLLGVSSLANLTTPAKKWGMDFSSYSKMLTTSISKELDYKSEVENLKKFKQIESFNPNLKVPDLVENLCTDFTIVESWQDGFSVQEFIPMLTNDQKKETAKLLLESFLICLFKNQIIQVDFNHGNFIFNKVGQKITLSYIDFGNCLEISDEQRDSLLKLLDITINQEGVDPISYLEKIGFDQKKLSHIHASLPSLLNEVFRPFRFNFNFDLSTWNLSKNVDTILSENKWWFRSAGPPEFFRIIQSYIGLLNLIKKLDTKINWHLIYKNTLKDEILKIKDFGLSPSHFDSYTFESMAKKIDILVMENDKEKVRLNMPINALVDLEDYIDKDVLDKLNSKGIKTKEVIAKAVSNGCIPGELFSLKDNNKFIKITLN